MNTVNARVGAGEKSEARNCSRTVEQHREPHGKVNLRWGYVSPAEGCSLSGRTTLVGFVAGKCPGAYSGWRFVDSGPRLNPQGVTALGVLGLAGRYAVEGCSLRGRTTLPVRQVAGSCSLAK